MREFIISVIPQSYLVLECAFKIPTFAKGGYRYNLAPFIGGFFVF